VDGKIGYCISAKQDSYANSCFDAETEIHETQMEEARILYVAMTRAIQHFIWFRREGTSKWSWGGLLEGLYCD
jgi:ATP-dependent exoDNAse (exonuclease V) beta subunit